MDAIALKLSSFYSFPFESKYGASIGDVFAAIKEGDWDHHKVRKDYVETSVDGFSVQRRRGDNLWGKDLPDYFTEPEWSIIKEMQQLANKRIHSATLPTNSTGYPFIIIPHTSFNKERVKALQEIGAKAQLYGSPELLDVKDENSVSSGSSAGGSPTEGKIIS